MYSGSRTRQTAVFLCPAFTSGGRRRYKTRKGKPARRLCTAFNLPTPFAGLCEGSSASVSNLAQELPT